MTEKEAIEKINNAIKQSKQIIVELTSIADKAEREGKVGEYYANLENCLKEIEACEIAVKALEEIQVYRAIIGTPEECREAVGQQNNIFDRKEMNELIGIEECRNLRQVINTLTCAPLLTKKEYISFIAVANRVLNRMEREEV